MNSKPTCDISAILINISSGIGDALMAIPALEAIRRHIGDNTLDVIVSPATRTVFVADDRITEMIDLPQKFSVGGWLRFIRQLRRKEYSVYVGFLPSNTLRQVILPRFARLPIRIKHRTPHGGFRNVDFLFDCIESIPDGRHRVDCNLDILKHAGITLPDMVPSLCMRIDEDSRASAQRKLVGRGFMSNKVTVGMHPGCSAAAMFKRWAPERYAQLADLLIRLYDVQIIIVGGPDELADIGLLLSSMRETAIVLAGECSLQETACVIQQCKFFVSNDSGIMHLAVAVGVPTFAIYGPKDDRHVGPYGPEHTVIRNGQDVNSVSVEDVIRILRNSRYALKQESITGTSPDIR